jgi:hypothetical protein
VMNKEKSKYASNPRACQPTDRQLVPLRSLFADCEVVCGGSAAGRPLQDSFPATSSLTAGTRHQSTSMATFLSADLNRNPNQ